MPSFTDTPPPAAEAELPQDLARKMRAWLDTRTHGDGAWSLHPIQHKIFPSGRQRRVLRAVDADTGRSVALKSNSNFERNRTEYAALLSLWQLCRGSVEPLFLADDGSFFAMAWVDAPVFERQLDGPGRAAALVRAGAWLSEVHLSSQGRAPSGIRISHPRLPLLAWRGDVGLAVARLRARARGVTLASAPDAMLHGDFHAGNFFDTGTQLLAFDRERDFFGPTHFDMAKFLVDIGIRRRRAVLAGRPWSEDAEADRRSFFDGYGALPEREVAAFDLTEDLLLFKKWHHDIRRGKRQIDDLMVQKGLLGDGGGQAGPGRLVADRSGRLAWATDPAPAPYPGLMARFSRRRGRRGAQRS